MEYKFMFLLLVLLVKTFPTTKGTHISGTIICHTLTQYTIESDKTCLTGTDIGNILSLFVNVDLKLVTTEGNYVSLSTEPCSCAGSFYINDTMSTIYTQKTVNLLPTGQLTTYNCGDFYLYNIHTLQYYNNLYNAHFCLDTPACSTLNSTSTVTDSALKTCPEVQPVLMESVDGRQLEPVFLCIFPPLADDVIYDVSWFINDEELTWASSTSVSYPEINSTVLRPSNWTGKYSLNFNVACAVKVHNVSSLDVGPMYKSRNFFAGIK
ncbi:uncharacterized protein LOC134262862, partial [Saccostrea cucullata]|uniref:uncharacterized protein LOC134262862 n=1 Tax=Saccostrea cuccullata TaxID=36930 RepID=UPI002ED2DB90